MGRKANVNEGSRFEERVAEILGKNGFWATVIPKGKDGSQPADIVAVNHRGSYLIDAKLCSYQRFVFSRMEDNQLSAMDRFEECTNGRGWFAIGYPGDRIYMIEKFRLCMLRDSGMKSLGAIPDRFRMENWLNENVDFK